MSALAQSCRISAFFFFNDTATTEIYTLSLHDALPISTVVTPNLHEASVLADMPVATEADMEAAALRSEEHTSELQSRLHLVCRLLLEKKTRKLPDHLREHCLACLHLPLPRLQCYQRSY